MSRPWEEPALRPWESQQAIYPRTVAIHRPNSVTGVGVTGYSGVTQANETAIATGIPASIQLSGQAGSPLGKTPTDTSSRTVWNVFIASTALAEGQVTERDIVIDDLAKRYQVMAAYWNALGYRLRCELLEA